MIAQPDFLAIGAEERFIANVFIESKIFCGVAGIEIVMGNGSGAYG